MDVSKADSKNKIIIAVIVILLLCGIGFVAHNSNKYNNEKMIAQQQQLQKEQEEQEQKKAEQEAKAKAEAEQKEKERKVAYDKATAILGTLSNKYDKVEGRGWYKPFGETYFQNRDICTWYVGKEGDRVWMRGVLCFIPDRHLYDWDIRKIIFSSSAGNYTVELTDKKGSTVIKQTSDGASFKKEHAYDYKSYYYLDCDYETLKAGFEILANGSDPVIRYRTGDSGYYDQIVSQQDINTLGTSFELYECFKVLDKKL